MIIHNYTINLPRNEDAIYLEAFCCAHIGTIAHDEEKFNTRLNKVLEDPNRYLIFLGDAADAIYPSGNEKRYDADTIDMRFYPPVKAYNYFREKLAPLAKKNKIVGIHTGNHDDKLRLVSGTDYVKDYVCQPLGVKYLGWMAYTNLFIKQNGQKYRYVINSNHGAFTGSRTGGNLNRLEDLGRSYDCDILLRGHTHRIGALKTERYELTEDGKIITKKQIFATVGSFHKSMVENVALYSERKDYPPLKTGSITIKIAPKKNDMVAIE